MFSIGKRRARALQVRIFVLFLISASWAVQARVVSGASFQVDTAFGCENCLAAGRAAAAPEYLFGVLNDIGGPSHYADEWARGVRATNLELHWKLYEPREGEYDMGYVEHLRRVMRDLKRQGWYVQLVPGYQYVPEWVFTNYPDMYYVNQYGERYDPDPITHGSHRVINAPFNPRARALISRYIQRIFVDFDQSDPNVRFDSVRVGGGVLGELRYPSPEWNGHRNSYWAFDAHAQNPADSGVPLSAVGWRPGIDANPGSLGRGQLIVNPGFEDRQSFLPLLGWSPDDEVVARLVSVDPHSGAHALGLTINSPNRIHQYVRVEPNTTYQLCGWLKSSDRTGRARLFFVQYNANTEPIPGAAYIKLESRTTDWTEQAAILSTSATTRYLKVEMDGDRPGAYLFDDLWLKREGDTDDRDRDINVPLAFYGWYVEAMTDYQNWQINAIRRHYVGQLDVVYAGKGLQPNQVTDALTNDLRGDGWSERTSALYAGARYERHVAGLNTTRDVTLYVTGIDEPVAGAADDGSPYPGDWSAARWVAYLARNRGMPVWGENSGRDSPAEMILSAQRMHANGFLGLMWGFESELYSDPNPDGFATIDDYEAVIGIYSNLATVYIPLLRPSR